MFDLQINDTILVYSPQFGLGDHLMARLLFKTFRESHHHDDITLALPPRYIDAMIDHPYIDHVVDINSTVAEQYTHRYDISVMHGAWNSREYYSCLRPMQHPADHMATRLGIKIPHDADCWFSLAEREINFGRILLRQYGRRVCLIAPRSSMPDRDLSEDQLDLVIRLARSRGFTPVIVHNDPFDAPYDTPVLCDLNIRELMGVFDAAHHVVSVETSHHHLAGGLHKPVLALYSFCDGIRYSRYYKHCVVRQEHKEGIQKSVDMARMSPILIADGYYELLEKYDHR